MTPSSALGAVIRGATPHFEYVSGEVTKGIAMVSLEIGDSRHLRDSYHRHHRTGHRTGRDQGREQGLFFRHGRRGNGQSDLRPGSSLDPWEYDEKPESGRFRPCFFRIWADTMRAEAFQLFRTRFNPHGSRFLPFFIELTDGVVRHEAAIDALVERFSKNWKLSRMSCVDRNILRIAVFELLCRPDIPAKVTINEAIEIGKKYGTEDSGSFINGILDSIRIAMESEELRLDRGTVGPIRIGGRGMHGNQKISC